MWRVECIILKLLFGFYVLRVILQEHAVQKSRFFMPVYDNRTDAVRAACSWHMHPYSVRVVPRHASRSLQYLSKVLVLAANAAYLYLHAWLSCTLSCTRVRCKFLLAAASLVNQRVRANIARTPTGWRGRSAAIKDSYFESGEPIATRDSACQMICCWVVG